MIFRQRIPAYPLNQFVEFLWFFEDLDVDHHREQLIPDSAVELIIDLDEPASPKKLYTGSDFRRYTGFRRAWISGMQNNSLVIGTIRGSSMMGAHFKTGGAAPFFGFPISELTAHVVELDLIWKQDMAGVRDHLLETESVDGKFDVLEAFLLTRAQQRLVADRSITVALDAFRTWPVVSMRGLAAQLGLSQKRMIHQFDKQVGFTPKMAARVIRFQKVLHTAHAQGECDWAELAVDCGYYDQAHLIHEFQQFAHMTPSTYVRRRTPFPNYVVID
jgi:AraC-like DNA-binding protein